MTRALALFAAAAWRQIARSPLRSSLIAGCAALGVAGAVASVNYATAGRNKLLAQIERLGTNVILVSAQQSRRVAGRARTGTLVTSLREGDLQAVLREVPGIVRSTPIVNGALRLKAGDLSKVANVFGVQPAFFAIRNWELALGDVFDAEQARRSARVTVLGAELARDLYGDSDPRGERLLINRVPFEVIGVLRERGVGVDGVNEDQQLYVPTATAMTRLLNVDWYSGLLLEAADMSQLDAMSESIAALLHDRHHSSDFNPEDFKVQSQKSLIDTQLAAGARLRFLVRWIGVSALLVSGFGVFAIAWIAVRARTREVGTRRALGATRPQVFLQFSLEAGMLALIGMLLGLTIGALATRWSTASSQLPYVFDWANAALALAVALLVNLLAAAMPALHAARMDPVEALRYE